MDIQWEPGQVVKHKTRSTRGVVIEVVDNSKVKVRFSNDADYGDEPFYTCDMYNFELEDGR